MNRLIDRRLNARGKSTVNRERFLRRYKTQIRDAVKRMVGERRSRKWTAAGTCTSPRKTSPSPTSVTATAASAKSCFPATANTSPATAFRAPAAAGSGSGGGSEAGEGAEAQDDFVFRFRARKFMTSSSTISSCRA